MLALKTAHQQTAVYPDAEWMRERERERERHGVGNPRGGSSFKCI